MELQRLTCKILSTLLCFSAAMSTSSVIFAEKNNSAVITGMKFHSLPGDKIKLDLQFDKPISAKPKSFTTNQKPRIILDFSNTSLDLKDSAAHDVVDLGAVREFKILENDHKTRLVLNLSELVQYDISQKGNNLTMVLHGRRSNNSFKTAEVFPRNTVIKPAAVNSLISDIDFKAEEGNHGKVIITTTQEGAPVNITKGTDSLSIYLPQSYLPKNLRQRLDVSEFGTPVKAIDAFADGSKTRFVLTQRSGFEHHVYQINKQIIVEIVPTTTANDNQQVDLAKRVYRGKRISLNFQDIKIRSVLQLLAEFTKLNIVVSDTVQGNITLRLNSVPWDQALDIILKTRGLAKREVGSVLLIAPTNEIAQQEKDELKAVREVENLETLSSDLIQVNYAKASEVALLLKDKTTSLLSTRGNVSVDERTNTLWVQDINSKIQEVRALVRKLDVPVKQVLIEARIVTINKDYERDLGVKFGITRDRNNLTGTLAGANQLANGSGAAGVTLGDRLNVNLPATAIGTQVPSIGIALAKLGSDVLLDLELTALESEGHGEIISSPRLITANQKSAVIESGQEVPYEESTSSGATSVTFKKAVLSLKVTPQITPDKRIILDLTVNQDSISANAATGSLPIIDTKEIQTNVLVNNGETIVLGGIYKQAKNNTVSRVPFFSQLPVIGNLFKSTSKIDKREELLIFVTPRIVDRSFE